MKKIKNEVQQKIIYDKGNFPTTTFFIPLKNFKKPKIVYCQDYECGYEREIKIYRRRKPAILQKKKFEIFQTKNKKGRLRFVVGQKEHRIKISQKPLTTGIPLKHYLEFDIVNNEVRLVGKKTTPIWVKIK